MRTITRRNALSLLPALAAVSGITAFTQEPASSLAKTQVFSLPSLRVVRQKGGWETRPVLHGKLPDGEALDIHHSILPAGQMPHPPHKHQHAELMILLDGRIDFYDNGETKQMQTGDIVFAAPNQLHGWKNVGDQAARYYVIAIGSDT